MESDTLVLRGRRYTVNNIHQLPDSLSTVNVTSKSDEMSFGYFGELNPLSNFHPSPFVLHDQEYHCSEQYIQEAKAKYFNDAETYHKLRKSKTGLECKIIAKQTKNYNSKKWEQVAKDVCKPGIKQKFLANDKPRQLLLTQTKNKLIVECTKDTLWGNGMTLEQEKCLERTLWKGKGDKNQGIMGEILCEIRDELGHFAPSHSSSILHQPHPPQKLQRDAYVQNTTNHIVPMTNFLPSYGYTVRSQIPISSDNPNTCYTGGASCDPWQLNRYPGAQN